MAVSSPEVAIQQYATRTRSFIDDEFRQMDRRRSGRVSESQLKRVLNSRPDKLQVRDCDVSSLFAKYSTPRSGKFDYSRLVQTINGKVSFLLYKEVVYDTAGARPGSPDGTRAPSAPLTQGPSVPALDTSVATVVERLQRKWVP